MTLDEFRKFCNTYWDLYQLPEDVYTTKIANATSPFEIMATLKYKMRQEGWGSRSECLNYWSDEIMTQLRTLDNQQ